MKTVHVEIWSDVVCPFCYIGKRQFEQALQQFEGRDSVTVEWKSYQLDASTQTDPNQNALERLAEKYGWTLEQAKAATQRVADMAKTLGLHFQMDKTCVINSFDAHRLTHLAKTHGKQNDMEEKLFSAHFCEGKNAADVETLVKLGTSVGLDESDIRTMLASDAMAHNVRSDVNTAQEMGIRGVPFFVFNRKWAVSGAQGSEAFLQVLKKASESANEV